MSHFFKVKHIKGKIIHLFFKPCNPRRLPPQVDLCLQSLSDFFSWIFGLYGCNTTLQSRRALNSFYFYVFASATHQQAAGLCVLLCYRNLSQTLTACLNKKNKDIRFSWICSAVFSEENLICCRLSLWFLFHVWSTLISSQGQSGAENCSRHPGASSHS